MQRGGTLLIIPDPSDDPNAEIIRVTAVSGTTLTIDARRKRDGGGAASTKNAAGKTYKLILGITAKMITDIGANLQQPWKYVDVDGVIDGVNTDSPSMAASLPSIRTPCSSRWRASRSFRGLTMRLAALRLAI